MYSRSKPEGAWAPRWHQHWVGAGTIKFTQPSRHTGLQMCVCARAPLSNRKWDAETLETLKATSWFLINTSSESFTFACNTDKKEKVWGEATCSMRCDVLGSWSYSVWSLPPHPPPPRLQLTKGLHHHLILPPSLALQLLVEGVRVHLEF